MLITHQIRHISKIAAVAMLVLVVSSCSVREESIMPEITPTVVEIVPTPEPMFSKSEVPLNIQNAMWGVTISESSPVSFDDLSYLTLSYIGYDELTHTGHMIVDKNLADEVICIFRELYEVRFPIDKMKLPYEYDGIDELSMQDNNTSAFNDRPIEGSGGLSYHQLGRAIDINPLVNPYIKHSSQTVLPVTAGEYLDRTLDVKGMIKDGSECVKIFEKYGWTWGGTWRSLKDYQHFEKH